MGYYRVNFGDYSLAHSDEVTYLNYFEFKGKKYPIGSYVTLNDRGMLEMFYSQGYNYVKGGFRLVDHCFTDNGCEKWTYFIGHLHNSTMPVVYCTHIPPDELLSEVLNNEFDENIDTVGELQVEFKEPNYSPKDWEVEGVMFGWCIMVFIWIFALVFKDWWIKLLIQIGAGWYFGMWRENKINKAISTQKFKKKN